MQGSTHLAGGLLTGALAAQIAPTDAPLLAGMAVAGVAALAPDWLQVNVPGANHVVRGITGHRGLSHWVLTAAAVYAVLRLAGFGLADYVFWGWLSHILLDLLAGGAPALWPWPRRVTLAHIKTGGQLDMLFGAACLVLSATVFIGGLL